MRAEFKMNSAFLRLSNVSKYSYKLPFISKFSIGYYIPGEVF